VRPPWPAPSTRNPGVETLVAIGDFSKMTYLSVKALRHYHDVGLLQPADIDQSTGYRRYATSQVPVAQAIRRFRDLDMPLEEIRLVLAAPDAATGNRALVRHLERMQHQLEQTQRTVSSLQEVLSGQIDAAGIVEIRRLDAIHVLSETAQVRFEECSTWLPEVLLRLHHEADRSGGSVTGSDGALYSSEFFEYELGEVTAFIPVSAVVDGGTTIPASTVAVLTHKGPFEDLDRTYGALGGLVAERGIAGTGPIREHYVTDSETDVCWPVIGTASV
jgi:DNA-binding transcriptional MerR regulator